MTAYTRDHRPRVAAQARAKAARGSSRIGSRETQPGDRGLSALPRLELDRTSSGCRMREAPGRHCCVVSARRQNHPAVGAHRTKFVADDHVDRTGCVRRLDHRHRSDKAFRVVMSRDRRARRASLHRGHGLPRARAGKPQSRQAIPCSPAAPSRSGLRPPESCARTSIS